MSKVICYPRCSKPSAYEDGTFYFEVFSTPEENSTNVGHVGVQIIKEMRRSQIHPSVLAFDFLMIALGVVSADKAVLRSECADGWTRQIELTVFVHEYDKWLQEKKQLEEMLRFLTGDFWTINFKKLYTPICPEKDYPLRSNDCVCLLSGGMDSLVGAIDLHEEGRNPLFLSQIVRGDADHQRAYAAAVGEDNLCQWSNNVKKHGRTENSTRARSIIFFAYALLASCGIDYNEAGRKEIIVPENGYISLNIPLNRMRIGSLSTKTTHPVYMRMLQNIWDDLDLKVDLVLPYKYKTKGEVLVECKNQKMMKSLVFGSTSCGKYQRHGLRHCGECVPCLVRRAAFLKAGLEDDTENGYCVESLKGSDSQDVAAAAMACIEVQNNGIDKFVKSALSFCDSTERNGYLGVVSRGLEEIRILLLEHEVL
ncbi:MAG: hypothetical protein HXK87_05590 [Lachnospiraceae bacterium]|jgi:hypothetical protein|nr:hypothetical protein [Lachnospiraceae bacterium]